VKVMGGPRTGRDPARSEPQDTREPRAPREYGQSEPSTIIADFLDNQEPAIRLVAGWARSVASHRAWGFETPDDIVQAALLALVRCFRENRFAEGDLPAYVRRIAKNLCVSSYRRARVRGTAMSIDSLEALHDPATRRSSDERVLMLRRILEGLGERCREMISLAYLEGFSRREIAERLGTTEGAVKVRLCRCLQEAREVQSGGMV